MHDLVEIGSAHSFEWSIKGYCPCCKRYLDFSFRMGSFKRNTALLDKITQAEGSPVEDVEISCPSCGHEFNTKIIK